jgi:hypothetical protein
MMSDLRKNSKIYLKITIPHPESTLAKQHFQHDIEMVQEDTAWKVISGLATPVVANYH